MSYSLFTKIFSGFILTLPALIIFALDNMIIKCFVVAWAAIAWFGVIWLMEDLEDEKEKNKTK